MSEQYRGRRAPSPPPPFPGSASEPAGVYAWNNVRQKGINPLTDSETPARSELSKIIALYAADNQQNAAAKEALSDAAWTRYFWSESRDPELRDFIQEKTLSHARLAKELQRHSSDAVILDDLRAQPDFISKPVLSRISFLQQKSKPRLLSRYLRDVVAPAITRLDAVRSGQMSVSFRSMAGCDGLDGLLRLPAMNQHEVKRLSILVAAHMDMSLASASDEIMARNDVTQEEILQAWEHVASETLKLDVLPPAFDRLTRKRRRRKPVPYELIPGSLARMICAAWWYRKLWQVRCEWREEQLRAACLVSKRTSPYISQEAVIHKREQRRRAMEFFRAHELVNEDGDKLDMEDVVNASASNPAHRRNEMMACVKGLELIAEMRRDCAVFYTITCPSRFHATLDNGKPNPAWNAASVRQSSDYLVGMFAAFRKAMHKAGLRWYGVRVAEPHHDGTVHWHLLCFMRRKDRRKITALLRRFAIREDRAELGRDTSPRFKEKLIDPRKGTPASYIAKYISKNIDGRGLSGEISKETGKSLRDSAEHVTAWASLHRVQQFRFFGIPGRQAYRELRLLSGQSARSASSKKPGTPVFADPRLDAVAAAADVGCFGSYIMKQGGVLIARKHYLIHTAYEQTPEPGTYGDHGVRIYGIWSPLVAGRVCTHATQWKKVRKTTVPPEATADQGGTAAPWTRGNNCPPEQKSDRKGGGVATAGPQDYGKMSRKERRELLKRVREVLPAAAEPEKPVIPADKKALAAALMDFGSTVRLDLSERQVLHLMDGGSLRMGDSIIHATATGEIRSRKFSETEKKLSALWLRIKEYHCVDVDEIRRNPSGFYARIVSGG